MKTRTQYSILALLFFIEFSCSTLNKQLQGVWLVEEINQDSKNIIWEQQVVTIMTFNKNGTCKLPIRDNSKTNNAKWQMEQKNNTDYITISEAEDSLFNGIYAIKISEKHQLNIKVKVLELHSEKLYLKCTQ